MKLGTIVLHDLVGTPLFVRPDHIGDRRPVEVQIENNPNGKTVLEIDGARHEVRESMDEIDKLIAEA